MSILSIDIGGTFIKYALMDQDAAILSRGKIPTPQKGRTELVEAIGRLYDDMPDVEGIAISMPGIIDSEKGYCVMGGALGYNDDFYFRHVLYERCPVKIVIENDAKCAAMAEARMGALKDVSDGLVLIEYIRRHLNQLYSDCPYRIPRAEIVTCKFQNDANLYGAMQCYLENVRM